MLGVEPDDLDCRLNGVVDVGHEQGQSIVLVHKQWLPSVEQAVSPFDVASQCMDRTEHVIVGGSGAIGITCDGDVGIASSESISFVGGYIDDGFKD